MIAGFSESLDEKCSRAGCISDAAYRVSWRNPKIHGDDRVKVWLACGEHSTYLHDYLAQRGFPAVVTTYDVEVTADELTQAAARGSGS